MKYQIKIKGKKSEDITVFENKGLAKNYYDYAKKHLKEGEKITFKEVK
jgi:hypothetical protein